MGSSNDTTMFALAARRSASTAFVSRRALSYSAVAQKDLIQDLYLRELKGYKPPPVAKDAHVGSVKQFSTPSAPKAPAVLSGAELNAELEAYDKDMPAVAQSSSSSGADATESADGSADEFLRLVEQDVKPAAAH